MKREPSTERGGERKEQILRTALRLFAKHGIEATGLRQIAQEVGIAQPALYHYFESKAALVDAVIAWRADVMAERFPSSTFAPPPGRSLRQGLLDYLGLLHGNFADPENEAIHRVILAEFARRSPIAAQLREAFVEPQLARLEKFFANLIAAGKIRDLDPRTLALEFIGPLLLAAFSGAGKPALPATLQALAFQHLEVFIRGVERT